jgi:hypothetical protein
MLLQEKQERPNFLLEDIAQLLDSLEPEVRA